MTEGLAQHHSHKGDESGGGGDLRVLATSCGSRQSTHGRGEGGPRDAPQVCFSWAPHEGIGILVDRETDSSRGQVPGKLS